MLTIRGAGGEQGHCPPPSFKIRKGCQKGPERAHQGILEAPKRFVQEVSRNEKFPQFDEN